MSRKTINVAKLLFKTNFRNRSTTVDPDVRKGWNILLGEILHATDNYRGFSYLMPQNVPPGCAPGVNAVDMATATMEEKFDKTDATRITFCVSRELAAEYQALQDIQNADVEERKAKGDASAGKYLAPAFF